MDSVKTSNKINNWKLGLPLAKYLPQYRVDLAISLGLALAIAISTYLGTHALPDPLFTDFYAQDVWFGSDLPTVFGNITSLNSDFGRNNKHPLFPLIVFPLVLASSKLLHLDPLAAVRVVVVGVAIVWICALYALFRLIGCYRLDATLLSLVGGASAAAMFFLVVPETFPLGSLTIILGLAFVAYTQYRPLSPRWYIAVNIVTVSITITNVMVGMLATLVNHRWRTAIRLFGIALLLATGLWILQRIAFTNAGFPFQPGTFIGEKKFVSFPGLMGIVAVWIVFCYQTMVMQVPQFRPFPIRPDWVKIDIDPLNLWSGNGWGAIAIVSWTGLLILGLWAFVTIERHHKLRIVLGLTLLAQLVMHSIYGVEETFIYSLHFLPLLLVLVALSLLTRLRVLSLLLAAILLVSTGINNRTQFGTIATTLANYGTPQQQVATQMQLRPTDPWPRNVGRVVLSAPDSSAQTKAFHEPGGSFSPQPGSFGVSIWVVDRQGKIETTSDRLPLKEIEQQLTNLAARKATEIIAPLPPTAMPPQAIDLAVSPVPEIITKTKYYTAAWSAPQVGRWQLKLKSLTSPDRRIVLAIRSVGPAGGAIPSLDWHERRLQIGDRWSITNLPLQAKVYLGSEQTPGWIREQSARTHWVDPHGWSYARIELNPGQGGDISISDRQPPSEPTLSTATGAGTTLALALPDPQFAASLQAQETHLLMGIVGTRIHPSDPISYPLPRYRDGAYQLVALARAGQLDVAKQLSAYFAENDFINSTLPEADIPAVGIWALTEVASAIGQPDYDRWLWPHLQRKAKLIEQMLTSNRPGYPVLEAAKSPFAEYPDLTRVDLAGGKMTNTPGTISLNPTANAMSYRALLSASTLANRLQQGQDASRWRSQAVQLKTAWHQANPTGSAAGTDGLWPSGIDRVTAIAQVPQQGQESSPKVTTTAVRPTLAAVRANIAAAHQSLLRDRSAQVWPQLEWLWHNQTSPGLYTWSGEREEVTPASFSHWQRLRVASDSQQLTPHYWTAAELLLLQLDMLTYIDRSTSSPTLIVGAGIPKNWSNQTMSVKGQLVEGNLVNWTWDGKHMNVEIKGEKMTVQLGSAFSKQASVNVLMLQEST
jgi:hypothetical protein